MKNDTKKIEFSKLIFWLVWSTNAAVIIFSMVMMAISFSRDGYFDCTPLVYLIPSTAAELATASSFYYWKARSENRIKLALANDIKIDENTIYS